MGEKKGDSAFAVLFFPQRETGAYIMHVSDPPPVWLGSENMSRMVIEKAGMYCLFFLIRSEKGGGAYLTVNGREIRGSYSREKENEISGSAVCSIREAALPCTLGIKASSEAGRGLLLVTECDV